MKKPFIYYGVAIGAFVGFIAAEIGLYISARQPEHVIAQTVDKKPLLKFEIIDYAGAKYTLMDVGLCHSTEMFQTNPCFAWKDVEGRIGTGSYRVQLASVRSMVSDTADGAKQTWNVETVSGQKREGIQLPSGSPPAVVGIEGMDVGFGNTPLKIYFHKIKSMRQLTE